MWGRQVARLVSASRASSVPKSELGGWVEVGWCSNRAFLSSLYTLGDRGWWLIAKNKKRLLLGEKDVGCYVSLVSDSRIDGNCQFLSFWQMVAMFPWFLTVGQMATVSFFSFWQMVAMFPWFLTVGQMATVSFFSFWQMIAMFPWFLTFGG